MSQIYLSPEVFISCQHFLKSQDVAKFMSIYMSDEFKYAEFQLPITFLT